jgi:hypothetical protein
MLREIQEEHRKCMIRLNRNENDMLIRGRPADIKTARQTLEKMLEEMVRNPGPSPHMTINERAGSFPKKSGKKWQIQIRSNQMLTTGCIRDISLQYLIFCHFALF